MAHADAAMTESTFQQMTPPRQWLSAAVLVLGLTAASCMSHSLWPPNEAANAKGAKRGVIDVFAWQGNPSQRAASTSSGIA